MVKCDLKIKKIKAQATTLLQTTKTERDDQSKAVTLSRLTRRRGLLVGRSRLVGGRLNNTRSKKALLLRGSYIVKLARGETLVRGRPDFFCPLVSTPSSHGWSNDKSFVESLLRWEGELLPSSLEFLVWLIPAKSRVVEPDLVAQDVLFDTDVLVSRQRTSTCSLFRRELHWGGLAFFILVSSYVCWALEKREWVW